MLAFVGGGVSVAAVDGRGGGLGRMKEGATDGEDPGWSKWDSNRMHRKVRNDEQCKRGLGQNRQNGNTNR